MVIPPAGGACAASAGAATATLTAALQFFAASQCLLKDALPPHALPRNGSCFDFVVVGSGTAGALVAARLAAAGPSVLLLEAGPDPPEESVIPGFRHSLKNSRYDWNFTTIDDHVTSQALSGGIQRQPRGRMLGGCGSFNDMVYSRGFPADYDEWAAELGDDGSHWRWESVLEYFKKTEHITDEAILQNPELLKYHGRNGEIEVSGTLKSTFETDRFLGAFKEMGFNIVEDMTSPLQIGAGRFSHTIHDGKRDSTLTALLNRAGVKDNLSVMRDAFVSKILIENGTAYGVQVLSESEGLLQFYASKEIIVSAGTFNTPKLLQLSGIGPKDRLEELGIPVIQDLPVGMNLHDHVMVLSYLAADNGTCYSDSPAHYMNMIQYLYDRSGPLSINNGMGAYMSMNDSAIPANVPDFAFYPVCIPINSGFYSGCMNVLGFNKTICTTLENLNKNHELLSIAVVLLKPSSRGNVSLSSTNPLDPPAIYAGTFNDNTDLDGFPDAMAVVDRLAETRYFKEKNARPVVFNLQNCNETQGVDGERCRAQAMAMTAWHSVGTAAMGSVVDARLRVAGVGALRVVDASVMPKVVRGNTNAAVVMIAEQAVDFIKADYQL